MEMKKIVKKSLCMLLATVLILSGLVTNTGTVLTVKAEGVTEGGTSSELSVIQFATPEQLMSSDNFALHSDYKGGAQKVYFGTNGESKQTWYIAGSDADNSIVLLCDPALPMANDTPFDSSWDNKEYDSENKWGCDYGESVTAPTEVYANHYGGSALRGTLKALAEDENNTNVFIFTKDEKSLMLPTTIYTRDTKNNSVYSTKDKLYLAYGDFNPGNDTYITVGENSAENLNNDIKVSLTEGPYAKGDIFWLRAPSDNDCNYALVAYLGIYVSDLSVDLERSVVPAFRLNLSSVLFASAAKAATSSSTLGDAMTFRVNGAEKITSRAVYTADGVTVTYSEADNKPVYLYVQDADSVYSVEITRNTIVSLASMTGISSLFDGNTKIWLEKSENNLAYAVMAEAGAFEAKLEGYTLSLNGNIGVNFYMELDSNIANDSGAYMLFTLPDGSTEQLYVKDADKDTTLVEGKTYHVFSCEVASYEMTQSIKAQMFDGDGKSGREYSYTVRDYGEYIINHPDIYQEGDVEFAKALLNYGACSQKYFRVETENLANQHLEEADKQVPSLTADEDLKDYIAYVATDEQLGTFAGYSLTLKSETTLKAYFKPADGVDVSNLTFVANGEEVTPVKSGEYYVLSLENIKAWNLDEPYTFTASDGSNTLEFKCSALSYGYSVLKNKDSNPDIYTETLVELISALRVYQEKAEIYGNS